MTHDPDFNELTAFVERRLDETARQRVIDHLSTCRTCREVVAALATTPEARVAAIPAWVRRTGVVSLAAMLVVMVIVGGVWSRTALETRPPSVAAPAPAESPGTDSYGAPSDRPSPGASPNVPPPSAIGEDLQRRRGAERQVGGKTFRLVAGEWIDAAYDPLQARTVIEAPSPSDRADLLGRMPGLQPYAALGARVTVVFDGTVYKFGG